MRKGIPTHSGVCVLKQSLDRPRRGQTVGVGVDSSAQMDAYACTQELKGRPPFAWDVGGLTARTRIFDIKRKGVPRWDRGVSSLYGGERCFARPHGYTCGPPIYIVEVRVLLTSSVWRDEGPSRPSRNRGGQAGIVRSEASPTSPDTQISGRLELILFPV